MHRELRPGLSGPHVRRLDESRSREGIASGARRGRLRAGPLAPRGGVQPALGLGRSGRTDLQREQLRTAAEAAATACDARAAGSTRSSRRAATPVEVAQARTDTV